MPELIGTYFAQPLRYGKRTFHRVSRVNLVEGGRRHGRPIMAIPESFPPDVLVAAKLAQQAASIRRSD